MSHDSEQQEPETGPDEQHSGEAGAASADGGAPAAKRKMNPRAKRVLSLLGLGAVTVIVIWLAYYELHGKYLQDTDDAYVKADSVTIAPKISGYVQQVLVVENQDVKAGQPLLRIDGRDYQAQAAQAKAQIAEAEASADSARAQIEEQKAAIEQARAQLAAAREKARHDAAEVARYTPLAASGAETHEQLASLKDAATQSAAQVRAQDAALQTQERRIAAFEAQIRQADAQGQAAKAQLAAAQVDVDAAEITAPIDGRVGDKTVNAGQYVTPGTRLMSVVPISKLYVTANFKETQLALMRQGQPATLSVDALGGTELVGHVASIAPGTGAQFSLLPPENATGNFTKITQRVPVRIEFDATPDALRLLVPGLSVNVTVNTISAKGELDRLQKEQQKFKDQEH